MSPVKSIFGVTPKMFQDNNLGDLLRNERSGKSDYDNYYYQMTKKS